MDAAKIINHCVKLGFPKDVYPDEQYLKKVIRTRNVPLLDNFLKQTDVRQKVDSIRKNLLIQSSKDEKAKLPQKMQKFFKAMKLKDGLRDISKRNNDIIKREKLQFDDLNGSTTKLDGSKQSKQLQVNILQAKSISLDERIEKESALQKKIDSVSVTQYSNELKTSDLKEGVKNCMILLKSFYDKVKVSGESSNSEKLLAEIREILRKVPNIFAFQAILRELDWSIASLLQLNSTFSNKDNTISFEKQLNSKLHQLLTVSGIESHSQKGRLEQVKLSCGSIIETTRNELDGLLNSAVELSFGYDDEDELVGEYVAVMLQHLILKGKCEHIMKIAEEMKEQSKEEETINLNHATIIQSTQSINKFTEDKINTTQDTIAQMFQINQKLNFGKITMIHLVQDLKSSVKYHGVNRTMLNITQTENEVVPLHRNELQYFFDQSIDKFNLVSDIVYFELTGVSKLSLDDATAQLMRHVIGDGSTMRSLLESMRQNIKINEEIQSIRLNFKLNQSEFSESQVEDLKIKLRINREAIVELLDSISMTNVSSKSLLRDQQKIFKATLSNIYKNFIPITRKLDGKSYKSHENEFNLYYRMIKED